MALQNLPGWAELTREERFFTCILFNDLKENSGPFWNLFFDQLEYDSYVEVIDQGYEVCLFRDAAREDFELIELHSDLVHVKFDLVLTLSNQAIVIIEAKAHQGFLTSQLKMLERAREILQSSSLWPAKTIHLAGLCSSKYSPREKTRQYFDALITWDEIAPVYSHNHNVYQKANCIYGN